MSVAALYDIHGNLPALEAIIAEITAIGVGRIVVGGDVVPGPMPAMGEPSKLVEKAHRFGIRVYFDNIMAHNAGPLGPFRGERRLLLRLGR